MKNKKNAFTMIEMVFVIVVLGILAAIAVPKFAATRTDAQISVGRSDAASIRSAIVSERQSRLIKGETNWISNSNMDKGGLFGGILMYPKTSSTKDGHWSGAAPTYYFHAGGVTYTFAYEDDNGTFKCTNNCGNEFADFE